MNQLSRLIRASILTPSSPAAPLLAFTLLYARFTFSLLRVFQPLLHRFFAVLRTLFPISCGSFTPLRLRYYLPRQVWILTVSSLVDIRIVQPFTPLHYKSFITTIASADFSRFVVTTTFVVCETSRDKPTVFPRLPA